MKTKEEITIGTRMVYVPFRESEPVEVEVTRITKTRFFARYVGTDYQVGPFRIELSQWGKYESHGRYSHSCMYPITRLAELQSEYREKQDRQNKEGEERSARWNKCVAETKEALGGDEGLMTFCKCELPAIKDGDARLYLFVIPVSDACKESKGEWESLMIRCETQEHTYFSEPEQTRISASCASARQKGSGTTTSSVNDCETDTEAIWELIASRYPRNH